MYGNPDKLPIIKTARDLDAINAAEAEGFQIVLKRAETNPPFKCLVEIYRHKLTGVYQWGCDPRYDWHENFELVLPTFDYLPPLFENPFAAYLVPKDLAIGTRVWLEDLIEDFLGTISNDYLQEHWRLESAIGVWNGQDFDIDYQQERDVGIMIG